MNINTTALYKNLLKDLKPMCPTGLAIAPEDRGPVLASKILATTLLKKYRPASTKQADFAALSKFKQSNKLCGEWTEKVETMLDEYLLGEFKNTLHQWLSDVDFSLEECFAKGRTGPGAAIAANGGDYYTKMYSSPLSANNATLLRFYRQMTKTDPRHHMAEICRSEAYGNGLVVRGSRLDFVPKTDTISRVICVEPSLNMYLQLGLGAKLEHILLVRCGIDLAKQPDYNRSLARIGSASGDLCTIDLSSASDTISLRMLRKYLPGNLLGFLEGLRSKEVELPNGEWLELEMVSSMGNGFTFPLETLLFSAVVSSVYRLDCIRRIGGPTGNSGVFGDDIIVEKRSFHKVVRLLHLLGFQVNEEKTFCEGSFRESCGEDYDGGYPVRGVYLKDLSTRGSRYVAINRLNRWSAIHGVPLPNTIRYLMHGLQRLLVPLFENDDAGIKVPRMVAKPERAYPRKGKPFFGGDFYVRWAVRPVTIRIGDSLLRVPRKHKTRILNPSGLWLAFLRGYIRDMTIGVRTPVVAYRTRSAETTSWDLPSRDLESVCLGQLYAVISTNLAR